MFVRFRLKSFGSCLVAAAPMPCGDPVIAVEEIEVGIGRESASRPTRATHARILAVMRSARSPAIDSRSPSNRISIFIWLTRGFSRSGTFSRRPLSAASRCWAADQPRSLAA